MSFRDSWHSALVYFGLAEEYHDEHYEEEGAHEAELEDRYRERPNVRRLRRRRDEYEDIFAEEEPTDLATTRGAARGRSAVLKPVRGNGDVRVHLVVPKSFNDAQ